MTIKSNAVIHYASVWLDNVTGGVASVAAAVG